MEKTLVYIFIFIFIIQFINNFMNMKYCKMKKINSTIFNVNIYLYK